MWSWFRTLTVAAALIGAPAALAAPTCQDSHGGTIRCGTEGAMPVGWTLPREERLTLEMSQPPSPTLNEILELVCVLGVFFSLMAMLPEFTGFAGDGDDTNDRQR